MLPGSYDHFSVRNLSCRVVRLQFRLQTLFRPIDTASGPRCPSRLNYAKSTIRKENPGETACSVTKLVSVCFRNSAAPCSKEAC
jgi:hypothetical protein